MNASDLIHDTDLCVKCGLCLPHCPTYGKTQDENESPRGRISLIQGWAGGALAATPQLVSHVDNCLLCRACEAACPAYVPYASIVDRFRQETRSVGKSLPAKLKSAVVRKALTGPWTSRLARSPSAVQVRRLAERTGIAGMLGMKGVVEGLPDTVSNIDWSGFHPAQGREIAQVNLFLGCTASLLDSQTVASTIHVLNRLGVGVRVPETQACCGALHWHAGDLASAAEFAERNKAAFDGETGISIVTFASGCGAMLHDYGTAFPGEKSQNFSARVRDICQFLAELAWPDDVRLKPLSAIACVHAPCSLKNVLRADRFAATLLRRIPELEVICLPPQTQCCGAAGSYLLEHPDMAESLREDVLHRATNFQPDFLITSNPGCAMHLRAGLPKKGGKPINVIHPLTLLRQQLGD